MGGGPPQSTLNGNSLIPKFSKPIRILDSFTQNSPSMHMYIYIYIYIYDIYMIFTTEGFLEEAIESWP